MIKSLLKILSKIYNFLYYIFNKNVHVKSQGIFLNKIRNTGTLKIILQSGFVVKSKFHNEGQRNKIFFDNDVKIINCQFIFKGDECTLDLRGSRNITNTRFELLDSNTTINVNKNTGFNNNRVLVAGKGNSINIGSDCIFAENAEIWASDTHSIIDNSSNLRINLDKPIVLGDRIWVGNNALIMKGVTINNDAVIAAYSVVTKNIQQNELVGGIPAKLIKSNIRWDINRL